MNSAWFRSTFLKVLKLLQMKEEGPNFWWQPLLQKVWIIWSLLLHFNSKSFKCEISSSFIRFQSIPHDSGVLLSESSNFYKWKSSDVISGESEFCGMSELFNPPFCISILKVLSAKFLRHSLDFNPFHMTQEYFSQSLEISTN